MKLLVSCTNDLAWPEFAASWPELESFDAIPASLPTQDAICRQPVTVEQLTNLAHDPAIEQLLVFFSQAEYAIASQLQASQSPETAAEQWLEHITQLTGLQRKQRHKIKLVNLHQALQQPKTFNQQLATLKLPAIPEQPHSCSVSLELLTSCQLVRQQPALQKLNTLLQASALPLADSEQLQLNLAQFLVQQSEQQQTLQRLNTEQQQSSQQQAELIKQLESTKQENDLLLQQLFTVQEELERYFLQAKEANTQLQQANEQLKHAKQQLSHEKKTLTSVRKQKSKLEQTIQEQTRRHTLDVKTLQQKERELKKLQQDHKQLQAEHAGLHHQLYQAEHEVQALKNSRVWKTSAPLRKLAQTIQRKDPQQEKLQRDIGLLFTSDYFDADWYLKTYPDVAKAGLNPAMHYLQHGASEGRFPSVQFDGNWYLQRYSDVATSGLNPLIHFIKFGQAEGRQVSPKLLSNQKTTSRRKKA
ncbi:MAG: hypothetical protein LAT66_07175 [Alkalimonas sp.]|nr:hypothetical protein [Alkalimonas sp.]